MSAGRRLLVQALSWTLLATVVAGAFALIIVPKAAGGRPLTVLSGSMAGTHETGDVVVVRPVDVDDLQIGDVITFQARSGEPELVTHRIVGEVFGSQARQFTTQGDANNAADPRPVRAGQIKGEVWYGVPLVGYASVWLAGGWGGMLVDLTAVGLLLYAGWFIAAGIRERRRTVDVCDQAGLVSDGSHEREQVGV